jgi:uncharacterized protein
MSDAGMELCRNCGLCCAGAIFDRVRVAAEEIEPARRLKLPIIPDGDGGAIQFPCPAHVGVCTVYEHRPTGCRAYRCDLLGSVDAGETGVGDALSHVDRVRAMIAVIRPHLDDPDGPFWSQADRLAYRSDEWKFDHAGVCVTLIRLHETLARFFDARARRVPRV